MPETLPPPHRESVSSALAAHAHVTKFEELAKLPDPAIDVALGAFLIARDEYPTLDIEAVRKEFDVLAAPLAAEGLATQNARAQALRVSTYLFEELGFRGNDHDYYDPKNSYLSDVLARKTGIPITLALVYCEVAKRAGVKASGVAFPGHFLVRIDGVDGEPVLVDPFFAGRLLDRAGLTRLLHRVTSDESLRAEHLAAAPARAVLVRILSNLKAIHVSRGDHARTLLVLDRLLSLTPDKLDLLRERGLASAKLGALHSAASDLHRVLELDPYASDARDLRARLAQWSAKPTAAN